MSYWGPPKDDESVAMDLLLVVLAIIIFIGLTTTT